MCVLLVVALLFPLAVLAALLGMERVERQLQHDALSLDIETFLDTARPDEVETFVSQGFAPALERYWRRRHAATG